MESFVGYHGVDASTHQQRFDELLAQGLRMTWINVSGDPSDARYAAIWVANQDGPRIRRAGTRSGSYSSTFSDREFETRKGSKMAQFSIEWPLPGMLTTFQHS